MIDLNEVLETSSKRVRIGNYCVADKDSATALALFKAALDLEPEDLDALCNAALLQSSIDYDMGVAYIEAARELAPDSAHVLRTYALIAQRSSLSWRWNMSAEMFERSLKIEPNHNVTLCNYAHMLQIVGNFGKALEIYTRASSANPMGLSTRFHRSMCMLTLADTPEQWRQALDEYEIRHLLHGSANSPTGKPMYTGGETLSGREALLIVCEQGIGDAVMMARYVRHLKLTGKFARIYLLCREPWVELLRRVARVDGVFHDAAKIPTDHDYFIPSMSLLRATGYPALEVAQSPYIFGLPDNDLLYRNGRLKIGLCWQGNPEHGNDKYRSIGPDIFCEPFADIKGAEFYSLHTGEVNRFKPDFVKDVDVTSLLKLASVIRGMDLVITVDTAILHIAGALGVPAYALLPSNPDWRWQTQGDSTEWYPSVKLFRATQPLKWKPVLDLVRLRVEEFVEDHRSAQ